MLTRFFKGLVTPSLMLLLSANLYADSNIDKALENRAIDAIDKQAQCFNLIDLKLPSREKVSGARKCNVTCLRIRDSLNVYKKSSSLNKDYNESILIENLQVCEAAYDKVIAQMTPAEQKLHYQAYLDKKNTKPLSPQEKSQAKLEAPREVLQDKSKQPVLDSFLQKCAQGYSEAVCLCKAEPIIKELNAGGSGIRSSRTALLKKGC